MAIKIKKQYKQADGTIIEVEGSEAEVEAFEKKQQKQKAQIEQSEKKRTILYGKDLDAIRKIVQEELAKWPRYTYDYHYHYDHQPYWRLINGPQYTPNWYGTISSGQASGVVSSADPNWSVSTVTNGPSPTWYTAVAATGTASCNAPIGVYTTKAAAAIDMLSSGLVSNTAAGWGASNTSGFLMSPSNG